MATQGKQYGLIDPKGKIKPKITVADVFNNDSDSGEERSLKDGLKKKHQKDSQICLKKQTVIDIKRAMKEDPTVYLYDEVYDAMKEKELEAVKPQEERKAKYMDALLKTADKRKKENERRTQRQIQKEREEEGEQFKDKEEFITSAYREKLDDMKKAEEEEKKMEYIESIMDVTKQQDLGGFYRHLYKETVAVETICEKDTVADDKGEMEEPKLERTKEEEKSNKLQANNNNNKNASQKNESSSDTSSSDSDSDSSSSSLSTSNGESKKSKGKINIPAEKNSEICDNKKRINTNIQESIPSKRAKFENSAGSKKDRIYRQRESSMHKDPPKDRKLSPRRHEGRLRTHRDERGRDRDKDRRGERDRMREKDRRDDRWSSGNVYRNDNIRNCDSRRQRSRSKDRRDQERRRSPRSSDKDKRKTDIKSANADRKESLKKTAKVEKQNVQLAPLKEEVATKKEAVVKVNIWLKRTIGEVFDKALERFCERKTARAP